MTKAAELAKMGEVLTNSQIGGRRNMVINGAMQVAQRNSSSAVTITGDGVYTTVDRFRAKTYSGSGRFSMQQVTDTPNNAFSNSLKLVNTTTDTSGNNGYSISTILETSSVIGANFGHSDAESTTISFHVKSSVTGTYSASIRIDSSSGEPSNVGEYTINSANTWEKKTITFPPYTGGESLNNLIIDFGLGKQTSKIAPSLLTWATTNFVFSNNQVDWQSNSGATFFITGIQYEVGSVATPFEHRSVGEELALCKRYYQTVVNTTFREFIYNTHRHPISFSVSMRAAPTLVPTHDGSAGPTTGIDTGYVTTDSCAIGVATTATGNGAGADAMVDIANLDIFAEAEL